jgi:hypothetical protein
MHAAERREHDGGRWLREWMPRHEYSVGHHQQASH